MSAFRGSPPTAVTPPRPGGVTFCYTLSMSHLYTVNTDGGARGNPGPAGIGFVITKEGITIREGKAYLGETTNNQAEYQALIRALGELADLIPVSERAGATIEVRMDSELAIKQIKGEYKVKDAGLKIQHAKVKELKAQFPHIAFVHVLRADNARADELANEAMDEA